MGPSQSSQKPSNFQDSFVKNLQFIRITKKGLSDNFTRLYQHKKSGKIAQVKNLDFGGTRTASVEQYYHCRAKLEKNPYIFELIEAQVQPINNSSEKVWSTLKNSDSSSNMCTMANVAYQQSSLPTKTLWLLVEASQLSLEDQILNRRNKKPFEEIQIWSVLSSAVLGAIILLEHGFKEPVLSPRGIGLSPDGIIKVSQWEIVAKLKNSPAVEEGEVLLQKLSQPKMQNNNPLNELLLSYYWAPEGLKALQKFISLGKKEPEINTAFSYGFRKSDVKGHKFQIFSLGMTLISMCLRNFYYRMDTFSQKYLQKLTTQAINIRKVEGKELSKQLQYIIESMVKWDASERISYLQLRDLIINYLSQHSDQMRNSEVSIKTFQNSSEADTFSHKFKHKGKSRTSSLASKVYTNSDNTSFMEANSFTLADLQVNLVQNSNSRQDQLLSVGSNLTYEGSGMVEQGTGDDDWNLQQEKEQFIQQHEDESISSSPVTHRTEKSVKQSKKQIVCPVSTPNLAPSPGVNKNLVKSPSINNRSPYSQLNSRQSFESKPLCIKNNKVYLDQGSIQASKSKKSHGKFQELKISIPIDCGHKIEHSGLNSATNRGSYRSSNKDPPFIKSARLGNSLKTSESTATFFNQCQGIFLNEKRLRNELIIQYKNGSPRSIQILPKDIQDIPDIVPPYNYFSRGQDSLQIQAPDIFQTFVLQHEQVSHHIHQSLQNSNSFSKINLSPTQVLKKKLSDVSISENQSHKNSFPSQKNSEYMTFNKLDVLDESLEKKLSTFVPSKWNKERSKKDDNSLFTDPKLLEYIRSPIKSTLSASSQKNLKAKTNDYENTKFESSVLTDKENLKDSMNKDSMFNSYQKVTSNLAKNLQNEGSLFDNNTSKIVKEQVSKGLYEGQKKNGLRSGYGIFYYNEGGKYRGNWLNNKMHGKGTLEYADGRVAYQGEWCCDELHGKGVLYNQSPNFVSTSLNYCDLDELDECWIFYQGGFEHDDKSGVGLLVLSNQEQFVGEFKNDMAEGMGEYLRSDGTTVKGVWHRNKLVKTIEA